MNSGLVSIIIPTYNRAEFLREAIASVLAQTYQNFELLILDNCSADHTPDVVASFKDPRIKSLRHQCNIGSAANSSYGVYWAKGEYLAILFDDDWYRSDFLHSRVNAFTKYGNVQAVFSNYEISDETGNVNSSSIAFSDHDEVISGRELVAFIVKHGWHIGATLYKRDVIIRFWEEGLRAGKASVTALNIKIAIDSQNHAAWICDKGLVYRIHSGQDSIHGGDQVLIGHVCAFNEPLQFSECSEYSDLLSKGAAWAYDILGRRAWDDGRVRLARKLFFQQLRFGPFSGVVLLRLLRCYLPILYPKKNR